MNTGAIFSPCRLYRYQLWRRWGPADTPPAMFLMLNPSTADDVANDPTVERCQRRADQMGYGGLLVGNIFAYRSTLPRALYACTDPVGPGNDAAILGMARDAGIVICAWGGHGKLHGRGEKVIQMLKSAGITPHALIINADGTPKHPLYIPYSVRPKVWHPKEPA